MRKLATRLLTAVRSATRSGGIARALANRNYRIYVTGNITSLVGTWIQRVGVGWLTWELTQSATWLGLVAASEFLPSLLVGPLGGVFADRVDRLTLTKICQGLLLLQALALGVLTLGGVMTPWLLFGLTLLHGFVTSFNQPARLSLIASLVRREDIAAAVAVNSIMWNLARFAGPMIAGVLIVQAGAGWTFLANGLSFTTFQVALWLIRLPPQPSPVPRGIGREMIEGFRYVWRHPAIAPLMVLLLGSAVLARPFVELLPGFAASVFGRGPEGLALLTSAVGVGAVMGGLWLGQRGRVQGLTAISVSTVLALAFAMLALSASNWFPLGLMAVTAAGTAMVIGGVTAQSLVQATCEPLMLGRVLSIYGLTFRAGPALGALIMGTIADQIGLRAPVAGSAVLCMGLWWWAHRRRPAMARILEGSETAKPPG